MMLIGIARALDMTEQQKSLADILMHTNAAGFLLDLHGKEHTDETRRSAGRSCARCSARRTGTLAKPLPARSSLTMCRRTSEQRARRRRGRRLRWTDTL